MSMILRPGRFEDWTAPTSWSFVQAFPTPQASKRWETQMGEIPPYAPAWRPGSAPERLEIFAKATVCGSDPVTEPRAGWR